jgi:hypothetical protein
MKTIILKVEVPDGLEISGVMASLKDGNPPNAYFDECRIDYEEITPPTEEEIIKIIDNHLMLNQDDTPYCGHNAAKQILSKITGQ